MNAQDLTKALGGRWNGSGGRDQRGHEGADRRGDGVPGPGVPFPREINGLARGGTATRPVAYHSFPARVSHRSNKKNAGELRRDIARAAVTARGIGRRVRPNSLAAYASVDLARRQRQVYDAIVELCRKGWRPCDADAGRILRTGNKVGKSGRKIACWRPVGVQLDLFGEAKGS